MLRRFGILSAFVESFALSLRKSHVESMSFHQYLCSTTYLPSSRRNFSSDRIQKLRNNEKDLKEKPYDYGEGVQQTSNEIYSDWLKNAQQISDPNALTESLKQLRNIVEVMIENKLADKKDVYVEHQDSIAINATLEMLKLLAEIYSRGRPPKDDQEFEHIKIISNFLRAQLESANSERIKVFGTIVLDACMGEFHLDDVHYGKLGSFGLGMFGEFSVRALASIAYRVNRSDILEKLAEIVKVDPLMLDKLTKDICDGLLLLSLYQFKLLMDKKKLDMRMIHPGAKILALITARNVRLTDKEREHYQQVVKHMSANSSLIPVDEIKKTADLLLNFCAGNFKLNDADSKLVDSFSLFNVLGSIAIRKGDLDLLERLCQGLGKLRLFYDHTSFPLHSTMMDILRKAPAGYDTKRLVKIFLDHTRSCIKSSPPSIEYLEQFIEPAIKLIPQWSMKTTDVDPISNRCQRCNFTFEPRVQLTKEEHQKLKKALSEAIPRLATPYTESFALDTLNKLENLIAGLGSNPFSTKPCVLDAMNIVYDQRGMTKHRKTMVKLKLSPALLNFEALYLSLNNLKKLGYSPILVITYLPFPNKVVRNIEKMGAMLVRTKGVIDDIFVMNAALMLGPEAHVISNDEYRDHKENIIPLAERKLFDIWKQSNFVNFTVDTGEFHVPPKYSNGIHKDGGGYHIAASPEFFNYIWFFSKVRCVRTSPEETKIE